MFPVWCFVVTTQAVLVKFDPLENGEMKSQTKYSVHRLMMMQVGQKPPQHWRRAFHSVQQHRNSLLGEPEFRLLVVLRQWGSHWASHRCFEIDPH